MHVYICVYMQTCAYIYAYTQMCKHVYTCMYVWHVYVHMFVYIFMSPNLMILYIHDKSQCPMPCIFSSS